MSELWTPGRELPRLQRTMTAERMRWYSDALETVTRRRDGAGARRAEHPYR